MSSTDKIYFCFGLGILILFLVCLPLWTGRYIIHIVILILLYGYLATAWNVLSGFTGQLSLGHAIFFGSGAYFPIILDTFYSVNPWLGMLLGGIFAAIIGLLMGYVCFHYGLKGSYFALSTIAFGQALLFVVLNLQVIGGASGMTAPLRDNSLLNFQWVSKTPYFYIILVMTTGIVLLSHYLKRSRMGFFFIAIKENEQLAQSLGIHPFRYKLLSFMISAFLSAFAGSFYAQYIRYVGPQDVFGLSLSIEVALFAIVGGLGTTFGPLLGAVLMLSLGEITRSYIVGGGAHVIVYGIVLIIMIIYAPKGVMGLMEKQISRFVNKEGS